MYSSLISLMPIIFLPLFLVLQLLPHSWTLHGKVNNGRDFCPFFAHIETLVSKEVLIKYLLSEYMGEQIMCSPFHEEPHFAQSKIWTF